MEQKVAISELQRLEFKQAFEEFDKVKVLHLIEIKCKAQLPISFKRR